MVDNRAYRLGMYGNRIDRVKLKSAVAGMRRKAGTAFKMCEINESTRKPATEQEAVMALAQGEVDMVAVGMTFLVEMENNGERLPDGVGISGILKRRDSRYVVVRKRGMKEIVSDALVVTDSPKNRGRIEQLFEDVNCKALPGLDRCFRMLEEGRCDAVFALAEDVRAAGRYRDIRFRYTLLDYRKCVPSHGEGVYAVLTADGAGDMTFARKISDETTAVCFEIEEDVIRRLKRNEFVRDADVYAEITGQKLSVYADILGARGHYRYQESDDLGKRNLIVRKLVDRVNESVQ